MRATRETRSGEPRFPAGRPPLPLTLTSRLRPASPLWLPAGRVSGPARRTAARCGAPPPAAAASATASGLLPAGGGEGPRPRPCRESRRAREETRGSIPRCPDPGWDPPRRANDAEPGSRRRGGGWTAGWLGIVNQQQQSQPSFVRLLLVPADCRRY